MIWRWSENPSSIDRSGESFGSPFDAMGQLSSSESPAMAKNAVVVQSETPSTDLEKRPEIIGSEAARLQKMAIKPSQPIDICRGPSQPRSAAHLHPFQRPSAAQRLLQRSTSEMTAQKWHPSVIASAAQKQHQPRVIQPRRLLATNRGGNGDTTTTTMGGEGSDDDAAHPGRHHEDDERQKNGGHHQHKRSRGLTVDDDDSPTQRNGSNSNNQAEGQRQGHSGGSDKENGEGGRSSTSSSSKSSRNSRKRLNSLELGNMDYDALEGTSSAEGKPIEKDGPKGMEAEKEVNASESEHNTKFGADDQMMAKDGDGTFGYGTVQQTANEGEVGNCTVRRKEAAEGGRIAYLYGVYGACADTTSFAVADRRTRQHRRSAFADQANTLDGYGGACRDDCCCFEEEETEEEGRNDELLRMTRGCLVHSLHTVSDIIGYAKVVRAQRNETLGRLNDVMSQFDALIRSYSLAMKNGASIQRRFDIAGGQSFGGSGGDSANGTLQGHTQLEPAA